MLLVAAALFGLIWQPSHLHASRVGEASNPSPVAAIDDPEAWDPGSSGDETDLYKPYFDCDLEPPTQIAMDVHAAQAAMEQTPHPVDATFTESQLSIWRRIEGDLGKPLVAARPRRCPEELALPHPAEDPSFFPSPRFRGPLLGFAFTTRANGTGYYREPSLTASVPESSREVLLLAPRVGPPAEDLYCMPRGRRRARHRRHPDGRRLRRRRRAPRGEEPFLDRPPEDALLADAEWRARGFWAIDTANPNAWEAAKTVVISRTSADVTLLQEHRVVLQNGDGTAMSRAARRLGWNLQAASAKAGAATLASAGTAVAARRGIGIAAHDDLVADGYQYRLHFAWVGAVMRGGLHCGSIYLRDSEGLSPSNLAILGAATAAICALRGPWILGGDWNMTPATLIASNWLSTVDGVIVAPELPTCNSSVYDFFVISKSLVHAVAGGQRIEDAGLHPHWPVRLLLRGDARRYLVRRLVRPQLIPAVLPHGPLHLPRPVFPDGVVATSAGVEAATLQWLAAARTEWKALLGTLKDFEAPRFKWAPAQSPRADAVPASSLAAAAWRTLAARCDECAALLPLPS